MPEFRSVSIYASTSRTQGFLPYIAFMFGAGIHESTKDPANGSPVISDGKIDLK